MKDRISKIYEIKTAILQEFFMKKTGAFEKYQRNKTIEKKSKFVIRTNFKIR